MIISPPFLHTNPANEADLLAEGLCPVGAREATTNACEGSFPLSQMLMWHTGLHLEAPHGVAPNFRPVCAIADGEIIFIQNPRMLLTEEGLPMTKKGLPIDDGQTYNPFGDKPCWTDNGMLIIAHKTDIGADGATPTTVTFYSYYFHLADIHHSCTKGKKIYRKDDIGKAGQIYGEAGEMEIGISCDAANLQALIGRAPDWQDPQQTPTEDGRTDSVFGDIAIYLPADTPISSTVPTSHLRSAGATTTTAILGTAQWVQLHADQGQHTLTTYTTAGQIGHPVTEHDGEYLLYQTAIERHDHVIRADPHTKSSPSGWYELLRFGRNIGRSANDRDPLPDNAAHWRKIKTIDGNEVWADLNAPGTCKFSDADFLAVFGWNCYDDDSAPEDQRCDSLKLKALIRDPQDPESIRDSEKLALRLGDKEVVQKLRRAICKFPHEWDKDSMATRYAFMRNLPDVGEEEWAEFERHHTVMAVANLPPAFKRAQWHFHPAEFIRYMRKCEWLSKQEMAQLVPQQALRTAYDKTTKKNVVWWEKVIVDLSREESILNLHAVAINQMMRKYGITSPLRQASFFGNAIQETSWMQSLAEFGGNSLWYAPWYGRGFLQLTNPENYCNYWTWRGRTLAPALRTALVDAYKKIAATPPAERSNKALADENFSGMTAEIKRWRTEIGVQQFDATRPEEQTTPSDSAGWYWLKSRMAEHADQPHELEAHTVDTNHGPKVYYRSNAFWKASAAVNLPGAIRRGDYRGLNGFDSRCCAYGVAISVLTERFLPDEKNALTLTFPKDFTPRR